MPRTDFIATGFHVPERVVTNDDLSRIMDTSDEWITQRSGIKTRHWVSDGETSVTLARQAALQALAILGPTNDPGRGVLSTHLYADGRHAEKLWVDASGLAHDPFIRLDSHRTARSAVRGTAQARRPGDHDHVRLRVHVGERGDPVVAHDTV